MADTKLSRRDLAAALLAGASSAAPQTQARDETTETREQVESNREQLRKIELTPAVEPAFAFRP